MSAAPSSFKPVVVTRAEAPDGPLTTELRTLGLSVLLWPATATAPPSSDELERALSRAQEFDWIVFASRRAVAPVLERLPAQPPGVRIAAVGKSTAQVLRQRGWPVDVVPDQAEAGGLIAALAPYAKPGMRVLYPASSRALPIIAKGLAQLGAQVTQVEAYRTEAAALNVDDCRKWIASNGVGAVTFASPSAVVELQQALGKEDLDRLLANARAVAIGPTTARALTERGYPAVVAESANLAGLAATTLRVLQTKH